MKKKISLFLLFCMLFSLSGCSLKNNEIISEILAIPNLEINLKIKIDDLDLVIKGNYDKKNEKGIFEATIINETTKNSDIVNIYLDNLSFYISVDSLLKVIDVMGKYDIPSELNGKVYELFKEDIKNIRYVKLFDISEISTFIKQNLISEYNTKNHNLYSFEFVLFIEYLDLNMEIKIECNEAKQKVILNIPYMSNNISLDCFMTRHNCIKNKNNPVEILEISWKTNSKIAFLDESRKEGTNLEVSNCIIIGSELFLPIEETMEKFNEKLIINVEKNEYCVVYNGINIHFDVVYDNFIPYFKVADLKQLGYDIYSNVLGCNLVVAVKNKV